ncbi:hypothetical protein AHF37_08483 [Paragonimus kellicotti]|nr:hypothetical protein AHF37_08483 [Paragonimus kellicotti]
MKYLLWTRHYVRCQRCFEAVSKTDLPTHPCIPCVVGGRGLRCPLCHRDLPLSVSSSTLAPPSGPEDIWKAHLLGLDQNAIPICPDNPRRPIRTQQAVHLNSKDGHSPRMLTGARAQKQNGQMASMLKPSSQSLHCLFCFGCHQVREAAENLMVALYRAENRAAIRHVMPPDDIEAQRHPLYRRLFGKFDRIDEKYAPVGLDDGGVVPDTVKKQKDLEALQYVLFPVSLLDRLALSRMELVTELYASRGVDVPGPDHGHLPASGFTLDAVATFTVKALDHRLNEVSPTFAPSRSRSLASQVDTEAP